MAADGADRKSSRKQQPIAYDESTIQTLDALEHIRLRTGMYIGRIGDGTNPADGIYVLLKEVIDNTRRRVHHGPRARRSRSSARATRSPCATTAAASRWAKWSSACRKINTGGKYNDDVFQFSVGLNGVGTKAVNALSSAFEVVSLPRGQVPPRDLRARQAQEREAGQGRRSAQDGTLVRFTPGPRRSSSTIDWNDEFVAQAALVLRLPQHRPHAHLQRQERSRARAASRDLLTEEIGEEPPLYEIVHCKQDRLEFAFTHTHDVRRELLQLRERPVHQRRRHPPGRVPRGPAARR